LAQQTRKVKIRPERATMNRIDKFHKWYSSHKIISIFVIIGLIVIALGTVTDSLDKVIRFAQELKSNTNSAIKGQAATKISSTADSITVVTNDFPSFDTLYARLDALKGRFAEYSAFQKDLIGKHIIWDLNIDDVMDGPDSVSVSLNSKKLFALFW
jgi:hypothetical protein